MLIGVSLGIVAGIFYKFIIIKIIQTLQEKQIISFKAKSFRKKGFWKSKEGQSVWPYYLQEEWDLLREKLGNNYYTTVNIHLKNPMNSRSILTEIVYIFQDVGPPFDIVLFPKYTTNATAVKIIELLSKIDEGKNKLYDNLIQNTDYRKRVVQSLTSLSIQEATNFDLFKKIISELKTSVINGDFDRYERILIGIDFSRYVSSIVNELKESVQTQYDGPIYIHGDNIMSVELIRYESFYGISLNDCCHRLIPKV